jgi:hypothetical protein
MAKPLGFLLSFPLPLRRNFFHRLRLGLSRAAQCGLESEFGFRFAELLVPCLRLFVAHTVDNPMAEDLPPPLMPPTILRLPPSPVQPARSTGRVSMAQQRRIGAVAVEWAKLENALNDLIWTIQGKDLSTGRAKTEDLHITSLLVGLQNAVTEHLRGDGFAGERRSISNIIDFVHKTKEERNIVIHGTWGERDGIPVVGSLRVDTLDPALVIFEDYVPARVYGIAQYATSAKRNVMAVIGRLEALRGIPSTRP